MNWIKIFSTFIFCILISCKATKSVKKLPAVTEKDSSSVQIPYHPLRDEHDLNTLIKAIGNARIMLLGEASHGTSEYYTWRQQSQKN